MTSHSVLGRMATLAIAVFGTLFGRQAAGADIAIETPCIRLHVDDRVPEPDVIPFPDGGTNIRSLVARPGQDAQAGCAPLLYNPLDKKDFPFAGERDRILIRFLKPDRSPMTLRDAGLQANTAPFNLHPAGAEKPIPVMVYDEDLARTEIEIRLVELGHLGQGTVVSVSATLNGITKQWYFRMSNHFVLYGIGGGWLPIGLFSTNFKSDIHGLAFNVLPVGLAWGAKGFLAEDFYLGGSLFANWLIHPDVNESGDPTGDYRFASVALGLLLDINNYLYLGYGYGINFASTGDLPQPGSMFVVGVGPSALDLFKKLGN